MTSHRSNEASFVGPAFLRFDLPRGSAQPRAWRWIVATMVSVAFSLAVCLVVARVASALDPALAGYGHFQFSDYSRLTILGVLGACIGWPIVCWLTTSAARFYLWAAIAVVLVSLAPDLWIWHLGQPAGGVLALMVMHIGLGIVTYPAMVLIAPQRRAAIRSPE